MNEHDSERIAGLLEADGMSEATSSDDADVIVLNTCCIRENADNKLYGTLGHLKALKDRRPEVQIAVGGCLAQKDRDTIQKRAPWVDAVWGTHNVHHAADLLRQAKNTGPITEILEARAAGSGAEEAQAEAELFPSALPVRRELGWAAWVTIQVGCDNHCAFCIVPAVRGAEMSRPFGQIVDEVTQLADAGTREVTLLGQNVNSYGRDLTLALRGETDWRNHPDQTGHRWAADERPRARPLFADLLRAVADIEGIDRVRYTSPHPKDLRPETVAAMAEAPAVCEHLHLPLQSGSDRVLALMHRGYTADRYLEKLKMARAAIDDLAVTSDLIVGFPGETEEDFRQTLEVVAAAEYDSIYPFIYSPREGTEAAGDPSQFIPGDVARDRFDRLKVVSERSSLRRHEARVGRLEEVLVEGPSKKDKSVITGRTRQGKLVHFPPAGPAGSGTAARAAGSGVMAGRTVPAGALATVRVTRAAPHFLTGELVEVLDGPRHRTRIPVAAL